MNYFMNIIVLSQLYRLKSATIDIMYNMKHIFLVVYSIISLQITEWKNNRTYIQIESDRTLNDSVWTEINGSQGYEIKMMWNRNLSYLHTENNFINCLLMYIEQSRICPGKRSPWNMIQSRQIFRLLSFTKYLYF